MHRLGARERLQERAQQCTLMTGFADADDDREIRIARHACSGDAHDVRTVVCERQRDRIEVPTSDHGIGAVAACRRLVGLDQPHLRGVMPAVSR